MRCALSLSSSLATMLRNAEVLALVVLIVAAVAVNGQVLNGVVRAVTVFDTCTNSPLATDPSLARRVLPTIENGLNATLDKTPCGILGEATPITAITVALQTNEVAGGDNLVFTIPSIPNDPTGGSGDSSNECDGTLPGTDCQVLPQTLIVTFSTSNAVIGYNLLKVLQPIPFAMIEEDSQSAEFPSDGSPATNVPYRTFSSSESCSELINENAQEPGDITNPFIPVPNSAPVGQSQQQSVCPTRDQLSTSSTTLGFKGAAQYFPDYDYFSINPTCNILGCPTRNVTTNTNVWQYSYLTAIEPVCSAFRIQESPRTIMNIEVILGQGTNSTDFTQTGKLTMSTSTDGALAPDTSNTALGAIVTLETPSGFVGQPLSGGIITCGTCITPSSGDTTPPVCTYGLLSDISPNSVAEDGMLVQTRNPWTNTQGGSDAICANPDDLDECDRCNVPTQACRRILLQNPEEDGSWYYVTEDEWVRMFGSGCSKNGMATDTFVTRPEIAELMCAGGQAGTCVPGYEQTFLGEQYTSTVPCQNFLVQAQQLFAQSQGAQVSFGGVPLDYNPLVPPYWMDKLRLMRDPSSSGTIQAEVILYLSADYVGEAVSVSTGALLGSTILCASPQNNAAGEVFANVQNTGKTPGSYRVEANFGTLGVIDADTGATGFTPLDGGTTIVTDVTDCTLSLEPQQIGACTIPFTYAGPIDPGLVVELTLYSGTIVAGRGPVQLGVEDVQCFITSETGGAETFGTVDISTFIGVRFEGEDDDDSDDTCYFWQTYPWSNHCTPDSRQDWVARIIYWVTLLLVLSLGLGIIVYSIINAYNVIKIRNLQKKLTGLYTSMTTTTTTSTGAKAPQLSIMLLFFCFVCSAHASDTVPNSEPSHDYTHAYMQSGEGMGAWNYIIGNLAVLVFFVMLTAMSMAIVFAAMTAHAYWGRYKRRVIQTAALMTIIATSCSQSPVIGVEAQVNILAVSSFRDCVFTSGGTNTSTGLDCSSSEFITTIDMEIFSPTGTGGGNVNTATFNAALTTVPNQNSDEQQLGSGTTCPAANEDRCQTTTPAQIKVTASESVLIYEMQDISGPDGGEFFVPYNYYYVPSATVVGTTDPDFNGAAEDLLDTSTYTNVQCRFQSFYYSTGEVSISGQNAVNSTTFFTDILNKQQLRCPTTAQPPFNPTSEQTAKGAVHYDFLCTYTRQGNQCQSGQCQVNLEYTAFFEPLGPFCRVYQLTNPPSLGINIEVTITTPTASETLAIQTVTVGLDGSSAISQPNRLVAATILGPLEPDGLIGPDLPGMIVVCNGDVDNPGVLNMVPDTVQQTGGAFSTDSLAYNPWNGRPQTPNTATCPFTGEAYPQFPLPEPCGMSFLFPNDPWAMWYYVPPSLVPTFGLQCGTNGVDPSLYQHPPPSMQFNSLLRANGATVPVSQVIPSTQCIGSGQSQVCGTGEISNVFTCVPGFGIGYLDLDTETSCNIMASYRDSSDTMAQLNATQGVNAARSFLAPHVPLQWDNVSPNQWIRDRGFYYQPISDSTGIEMTVSIVGQLVDYPQTTTNGYLVTTGPTATFCTLNVTGTAFSGAAYFKVCNDDRAQTTGDYNLAVTCGYSADYDQATGTFDEASVLVSPGSMLLSGIEAGTCATASTFSPFLLEFLGSTTTTAANGTNDSQAPIQCVYDLFSAETVNPSDVLVSQTVVVCQTNFSPTFVLNNQTIAVPDTLSPIVNPADIVPPPPTDGDDDILSTTGKVVVWSLIGIVVITALAFACCMCGCGAYQTRKTKKLLEPHATT